MKRATSLPAVWVLLLVCLTGLLRAAEPQGIMARPALDPAKYASLAPIDYQTQTLENGLRVLYVPLHQAPVVHVRVMYHVGSKDERANRQGFAHMFEHMMFRGSAHVKPEQHMKLINMVGGDSNAFTSFDQTTYVNTIPAEHTEMALWLEADRMASFKVSEEIFKTERKVVAEEWGMRMNQPYGNLFDEYLKRAFTQHSYRWTPIGNMEQLSESRINELQDFFNTYYIPNNAILLVAGDIDVEKTKAWVKKYFEWIPKAPTPPRLAQREPVQTEGRRAVVPAAVPLPAIVVGARIGAWSTDDQYALTLLGEIVGGGPSSRLYRRLVATDDALCTAAEILEESLEEGGIFGGIGIALQGKKGEDIEKIIREELLSLAEKNVTPEELAKAKTQFRQGVIQNRKTAEELAKNVGEEWMFGGDPARANKELEKVAALTADDLKAVAAKYLKPEKLTTMLMVPDPTGQLSKKAAAEALAAAKAEVAPASAPVTPRAVEFPASFPTTPPMHDAQTTAKFAAGESFEIEVAGGKAKARVLVMADHRLPLASLTVALRRGSFNEPRGKEGLGSMAADMVRRGAGGISFEDLNQRLDSLGISIGVVDQGDATELTATAPAEKLGEAFRLSGLILRQPNLDENEFKNLKAQALSNLMQSLSSPTTVADRELAALLNGDTPLGRKTTPESLTAVTLADIKDYYAQIYRPADAIIVISGDVTIQQAKALAEKLLEGWGDAKTAALVEMPKIELPPVPAKRKTVLIDAPDAKQSAVRTAIRAYDIHDEQRYAGSLANQILSGGIETRVMSYVRAQKGLAYYAHGIFSPGRQAGAFMGETDTRFEATAEAIEAMFKVFADMAAGRAAVTADELKESRLRVAGALVMSMQTIDRQASRRLAALLNGFPADYWEKYLGELAKVTADQVQGVMKRYVDTSRMIVVVVAPAAKVKESLLKQGEVEVKPMPTTGTGELLK